MNNLKVPNFPRFVCSILFDVCQFFLKFLCDAALLFSGIRLELLLEAWGLQSEAMYL